jgi:hypothetical protein
MNTTIRHTFYFSYPNRIRELNPREENYFYLYPQYPLISYLFFATPEQQPSEALLLHYSFYKEAHQKQQQR